VQEGIKTNFLSLGVLFFLTALNGYRGWKETTFANLNFYLPCKNSGICSFFTARSDIKPIFLKIVLFCSNAYGIDIYVFLVLGCGGRSYFHPTAETGVRKTCAHLNSYLPPKNSAFSSFLVWQEVISNHFFSSFLYLSVQHRFWVFVTERGKKRHDKLLRIVFTTGMSICSFFQSIFNSRRPSLEITSVECLETRMVTIWHKFSYIVRWLTLKVFLTYCHHFHTF